LRKYQLTGEPVVATVGAGVDPERKQNETKFIYTIKTTNQITPH
jgi:hypothetical protein